MSETSVLFEYFKGAEDFMDHPENDLVDHVVIAGSTNADRILFLVHNPINPNMELQPAVAARVLGDLETYLGSRVGFSPDLNTVAFSALAQEIIADRPVARDTVNRFPLQRDGRAPLQLVIKQSPWQGALAGSFTDISLRRPGPNEAQILR